MAGLNQALHFTGINFNFQIESQAWLGAVTLAGSARERSLQQREMPRGEEQPLAPHRSAAVTAVRRVTAPPELQTLGDHGLGKVTCAKGETGPSLADCTAGGGRDYRARTSELLQMGSLSRGQREPARRASRLFTSAGLLREPGGRGGGVCAHRLHLCQGAVALEGRCYRSRVEGCPGHALH